MRLSRKYVIVGGSVLALAAATALLGGFTLMMALDNAFG